MDLNRIIKESLRKVLKEAEDERDAYTDVIERLGNYDISNAQDLSRFLRDPSRKINNGGFVNMVYVSDCKIVKKTFQNGGYTDKDGNVSTAQDIENMGRSMGKKYINSIFDSDEYKSKLSKPQGAKMSNYFALFTIETRKFNWSCNKYGEKMDKKRSVIDNATDDQLNQFTANDSQFAKRLKKFVQENPEMEDEINMYIEKNSFPRDIVHQIQGTKLANSGQGWEYDKNGDSPYVYTHRTTGNEALRITVDKNFKPRYKTFLIMKNGDVRSVSDEELKFLQKAFGKPKKTDKEEVMTELRAVLNEIESGDDFTNWNLKNIAKLSFSANGKRMVYSNHELNIGGITIDADDLMNAPMTEKRNIRRPLVAEKKNTNKSIVSESLINNKIRRIVRNSLRRK